MHTSTSPERSRLRGCSHRVIVWGCALAGVPLVALGLAIVALSLYHAGVWPFHPLRHPVHEQLLPNGGAVRVTGDELRDWFTSGYSWTATYRAPSGTDYAYFGGWKGGRDDRAQVDCAGELVVVRCPDASRVWVRGATGTWSLFALRFPRYGEPLASFEVPRGMRAADIERFAADLEPADGTFPPWGAVESFDAATRVFTVSVRTQRKRVLTFELSPDGSHLELRTLERVSGP